MGFVCCCVSHAQAVSDTWELCKKNVLMSSQIGVGGLEPEEALGLRSYPSKVWQKCVCPMDLGFCPQWALICSPIDIRRKESLEIEPIHLGSPQTNHLLNACGQDSHSFPICEMG